MKTRILAPVVAIVLFVSGAAVAGPTDVAINVTRLGGDTVSAQPFVDRFLRHVESKVGWAAGSAKGAFLVSRKDVLAYVADTKPGIGMIEPGLYFEMRKAWGLQAILQVESSELVSPRLHVVVKDPAIQTLDDLKGKRLWTLLADTPAYLSKVVLDGKVDAGTFFTLKQIGQALRGAKAVIRGDCEATILDDEQLAKSKEVTGGTELRAIYSSPPLPSIPIVSFGGNMKPADRETLVKAFTAMCASSDGASICKEMHVGRFVPLDATVFGAAQKRFGD
jgi:hypothetical protein